MATPSVTTAQLGALGSTMMHAAMGGGGGGGGAVQPPQSGGGYAPGADGAGGAAGGALFSGLGVARAAPSLQPEARLDLSLEGEAVPVEGADDLPELPDDL
jgi:hypothetical protein